MGFSCKTKTTGSAGGSKKLWLCPDYLSELSEESSSLLPLEKAYGSIVSNKRDAKDVVPYKMGANFYVLSVGEAFRLPFCINLSGGETPPLQALH